MKWFSQKKGASFCVILFTATLTSTEPSSYDPHFYKIVQAKEPLHEGLTEFLKNIFQVVPAYPLAALIEDATEMSNDDYQAYQRIVNLLPCTDNYKVHPNKTTPPYPLLFKLKLLYRSLFSLKKQTSVMIEQTKEFVGKRRLSGYLEIGSPGRYILGLRKEIALGGPTYLMPSQTSLYDIIERKSLLALGTVIPLTYEPLDPALIPDESLDLITCYIGLHHAPTELLSSFLASLRRALRPGGLFIIRDHDGSDERMPLLHVVHSVYNAVTGISLEEEKAEVRNFKPLSEWIARIESHGFVVSEQQLLQAGDPTANTLLCFTKKAPTQEEMDQISFHNDMNREDASYERDLAATYLTPVEWRSVDELQTLGSFLDHTPWYHYPYWKSIRSFWKHTAASTKATYYRCGARKAFTSAAAITNFFIAGIMTTLYTQLGILSFGPRFLYSLPGNADALTIKAIVSDPENNLAKLNDPRITILKTYERTGVVGIELPRYLPFTELMQILVKNNITIVEIAGQKELCIQIETDKKTDQYNCPTTCTVLYATPALATQKTKRFDIRVPLNVLPDFLKTVEESGYRVVHMFDY